MSLLPIVTWPDPRLTRRCAPVPAVDTDLRRLAQDMLETMYDAPGRGLAGPQVGAMLRLFVMDASWKDGRPAPRIVVNPSVVAASDDQVAMDEACLSIPGVSARVTRPARVRLRWTAIDGAARDEWFDGPAARIVQHEYDHLDGIVTFHRLDPEARAAAEEAYRP
ncbi:N-formylmethionyl-tRNA deformylase [Defluviimonas sp. 20V17]|uniref:Peptide deformylase n=1 Tax=Allgaiera indica TaxID=765699 RepID=A0AAN4UNH4_9RHOB|nr:peptide deformylase [Allgaiera indica]KDB04728.1 N-formylmethionyl-tRNA deformylase [Defluviimonas sp. 20V17]GHD99097.1 peptide deformylase [Allgaiera indica]SDW00592.1 peptide deformylase [Allgaiera indica]